MYSGKYEFPNDSLLHGTAKVDLGVAVPACVVSTPSSIVFFCKVEQLELLDFCFNYEFLRSRFFQPPEEIQVFPGDAYLQFDLNDLSCLADLSLSELDTDEQTSGWFRSILHGVKSGNGVHKYYRDRGLDKSHELGLTFVFQRRVDHEPDEPGETDEREEEEASKLALSPASVEALVYFAKNQRKAASPQSPNAQSIGQCNEDKHAQPEPIGSRSHTPSIDSSYGDGEGLGTEDAENHGCIDPTEPIDPILASILSSAPARACLFFATGETQDEALINSLSFPLWLEYILAESETCPYASDVTPGILVLEAYVDNGDIKVCTEQCADVGTEEARRLVFSHAGAVLIHTDTETLQTNAVRCDALRFGKQVLHAPYFGLTDYCLNTLRAPPSPPYFERAPYTPPPATESEELVRDLMDVLDDFITVD